MPRKKASQGQLSLLEPIKKSSKFDKKSDVMFLQGDCIKSIKSIPTSSVSLIISSPPYNLNKEYDLFQNTYAREITYSLHKFIVPELIHDAPSFQKQLISSNDQKARLSNIVKNGLLRK